MLAPWCREHGLQLPSVSTIGRIIAAAADKMRHAPARIDRRGRPKPVRRHPKPRKPRGVRTVPLQCLAVDTVERVRDGLRRTILTCIDPASAFGLAVALPSKAACHTEAALAAILSLLPAKPKVVLSDNGSEFEAGFAKLLKRHRIQRWYTYPKSPKMNDACCSSSTAPCRSPSSTTTRTCSSRTWPSSTRNWPTGSSSTTLERPHHRLDQKPPLSCLLQHHPECQRWWTHTMA